MVSTPLSAGRVGADRDPGKGPPFVYVGGERSAGKIIKQFVQFRCWHADAESFDRMGYLFDSSQSGIKR